MGFQRVYSPFGQVKGRQPLQGLGQRPRESKSKKGFKQIKEWTAQGERNSSNIIIPE